MLLIEVKECPFCKYYILGAELAKCTNEYCTYEEDGVFNYYWEDVINCKCECQFFEEKKGESDILSLKS